MFNSKLKADLAQAKQQFADAHSTATKNYHAAKRNRQLYEEAESRAQAAEAARQNAETALRQKEQEAAALKNCLAQAGGKSPFIKVGQELRLPQSIHTITVSDTGNVTAINGKDCNLKDPMPAEALEGLIAAHQNRKR